MRDFRESLIRQALEVATSSTAGDLPVGAIIADQAGEMLASGRNSVAELDDPSAHAEVMAIRVLGETKIRGNPNLTIAVTLEPCPMCAWLIRSVGIERVLFGAYNPNYGSAGSVYDLLRDNRLGPVVEVEGGLLRKDCEALLRDAFLKMRDNRRR